MSRETERYDYDQEELPSEADIELRLRQGDSNALAEAFELHRERLRRIIRFRLDYRVAGRVSDSDVLQDVFLAACQRLPHFAERDLPVFLWLRLLVGQQLVDLHRHHLQVAKRDAGREISIDAKSPSPQTSMAIAAQLAGNMTAASAILSREEQIEKLESALNGMDETDREVIALRHFEELSNIEAAKILGIEPGAASKRYVRAMAKLSCMLASLQSLGANASDATD